MDDFTQYLTKKTILLLDNAPAHVGQLFRDNLKRWEEKNLLICYLPAYSPELNIIEILWKRIKYDWLSFQAYNSLPSLIEHLSQVLKNIATTYHITFESS